MNTCKYEEHNTYVVTNKRGLEKMNRIKQTKYSQEKYLSKEILHHKLIDNIIFMLFKNIIEISQQYLLQICKTSCIQKNYLNSCSLIC
jgi:hypothetical protein